MRFPRFSRAVPTSRRARRRGGRRCSSPHATAGKMPADFRVSITNAAGPGAYPISSFTWLLLYENPKDKAHARIMVDFLKWALTDGQAFAVQLGYAPLPREIVALEMAALAKVKTSEK